MEMQTLTKYKLFHKSHPRGLLTTNKGGMEWEKDKWYTNGYHYNAKRHGEPKLCSKQAYHYYHHPLIAMLLDTQHGNYFADVTTGFVTGEVVLHEVDAGGYHADDEERKGGCTRMRIGRELVIPEITNLQRFKFLAWVAAHNMSRSYLRGADREQWLEWYELVVKTDHIDDLPYYYVGHSNISLHAYLVELASHMARDSLTVFKTFMLHAKVRRMLENKILVLPSTFGIPGRLVDHVTKYFHDYQITYKD